VNCPSWRLGQRSNAPSWAPQDFVSREGPRKALVSSAPRPAQPKSQHPLFHGPPSSTSTPLLMAAGERSWRAPSSRNCANISVKKTPTMSARRFPNEAPQDALRRYRSHRPIYGEAFARWKRPRADRGKAFEVTPLPGAAGRQELNFRYPHGEGARLSQRLEP